MDQEINKAINKHGFEFKENSFSWGEENHMKPKRLNRYATLKSRVPG